MRGEGEVTENKQTLHGRCLCWFYLKASTQETCQRSLRKDILILWFVGMKIGHVTQNGHLQ